VGIVTADTSKSGQEAANNTINLTPKAELRHAN
jgi:hypothetical protein